MWRIHEERDGVPFAHIMSPVPGMVLAHRWDLANVRLLMGALLPLLYEVV